jgi:membrane protein
VRVGRRYLTSDAGTWATNIAWNALFSFIPTLLLLVSLTGALFRARRFEAYLAREAALLFHASPAQVLGVFNGIRDKSWLFGAVSLAGLVWSGSSLFSCVDCALSRLSGFAPRPFLRRRRRAMRLTLVFCALLVPLLVSTSLLSVPRGHLAALDAARFGRFGLYLIQVVMGTGIATVLFAAMYRLAPNRPPRQGRVLPGALSAGVMLELLAFIFPLYFRATASSSGALLLLALPVLLAFFYCVGQVIVIGHLVNLESGDCAGPGG